MKPQDVVLTAVAPRMIATNVLSFQSGSPHGNTEYGRALVGFRWCLVIGGWTTHDIGGCWGAKLAELLFCVRLV